VSLTPSHLLCSSCAWRAAWVDGNWKTSWPLGPRNASVWAGTGRPYTPRRSRSTALAEARQGAPRTLKKGAMTSLPGWRARCQALCLRRPPRWLSLRRSSPRRSSCLRPPSLPLRCGAPWRGVAGCWRRASVWPAGGARAGWAGCRSGAQRRAGGVVGGEGGGVGAVRVRLPRRGPRAGERAPPVSGAKGLGVASPGSPPRPWRGAVGERGRRLVGAGVHPPWSPCGGALAVAGGMAAPGDGVLLAGPAAAATKSRAAAGCGPVVAGWCWARKAGLNHDQLGNGGPPLPWLPEPSPSGAPSW